MYFDQTASTLPLPEILDLYLSLSKSTYANPAAIHRLGYEAEQVIKQARKDLAEVLRCRPENLLFTSCATESINTALRGVIAAHPHGGRDIITWDIEHKATLKTCAYLAQKGYNVRYLATTGDLLPDLKELRTALRRETALISISLVNNELGSHPDIAAIVKLRDSLAPQAIIHIDAVQGWTKLPFYPLQTGVDLASFSGHKIYAPKGIGLLYIRKGLRIDPLILGGGQQNGLRSGTENPVLCACLARAAQIQTKSMATNFAYVQDLHNFLVDGLNRASLGCCPNLPAKYSPYILNVSFPGVNPETLAHALADKEIYVATHSACSSSDNRSHVLDALPIDEARKTSALRISLAPDHKKSDLTALIDALLEIVPKLRVKSQDSTLQR